MASSLAAPDTTTPAPPPPPKTVSDVTILVGVFGLLLFAPLAFGAGGPIWGHGFKKFDPQPAGAVLSKAEKRPPQRGGVFICAAWTNQRRRIPNVGA